MYATFTDAKTHKHVYVNTNRILWFTDASDTSITLHLSDGSSLTVAADASTWAKDAETVAQTLLTGPERVVT